MLDALGDYVERRGALLTGHARLLRRHICTMHTGVTNNNNNNNKRNK